MSLAGDTLRAMYGPHSDAPDHPCWHCRWWGGVDGSGAHSLCDRPHTSRVQSQPAGGCAFFEREPGADCNVEWVPIRMTEGPGVWTPNSAPPKARPVEWAP
jgi:hypothetical protein